MGGGVYSLVIHVSRKRSINIGRLGGFVFPAGFYVYIGSAQKNLERRIERHLRREKKLHWHIDYLLQHARITGVHTFAGKKHAECELSHRVKNMKNAVIPVMGFGSSDCSCAAHLYYFRNDPSLEIFRGATQPQPKQI